MIRLTKAEYRAGAFKTLIDKFDDSDFYLDKKARVKPTDGAEGAWIQCWIRIRSGETPKVKATDGCEIDQDTGFVIHARRFTCASVRPKWASNRRPAGNGRL